jgi:capsid assembly protease
MKYPLLASRVFGKPLALHSGHGELLGTTMAAYCLGKSRAEDIDGGYVSDQPLDSRGYEVVRGIATINVNGTLVHKSSWLDSMCGMCGYDGLQKDFLNALRDPDVKAIAFFVNSGGGEVSGCFDFAQTIYDQRGTKPIWAILDDSAYSAAYAIASACDVVTVPATGGSGSIGVISVHMEVSEALANAGVAVKVFQHGARKADGHEAIKLSPEAAARFQKDVDTLGDLFVNTVARNRGLPAADVRALEAGTFLGAEGLAVGLVDAVMPPDEAFLALLGSLA